MKYLQFKMEGVDDQGIFTGHASVFNVVDLDGDVVEPGAFAETLATGAASAGVLIFGQHEDRKEPLGRTPVSYTHLIRPKAQSRGSRDRPLRGARR